MFSNREIIIKYAEAIHELFMRIEEKLVEGLGIKSEKNGFENWPYQFNINKCDFTPGNVGFPGVQIHTDSRSLLFSKMMKALVV